MRLYGIYIHYLSVKGFLAYLTFRFLDIPSGESGFIARSCLTHKLICETILPRSLHRVDFLIFSLYRIPRSPSNFTYAFLPQNFLRGLFAGYGMDLPASLTKSDLTLLDPNDTIPSVIDSSKMSYLSEFLIPSTIFCLTLALQSNGRTME